MSCRVLVLIGTRRGAFILESDEGRRRWALRGPFCEASPVNHLVADPGTGMLHAGSGGWGGPLVWSSPNLGATWTSSGEDFGEGGEGPVKAVWSLASAGGLLLAGVEPAALFASRDGGRSWRHLPGLQEHPSRPYWQAGGGGLILHSILPHATDGARLWIGISAAGVFHSGDGGKTWEPRNRGTRADYMPEDQRYPEYGQCVHCLVGAPGMPERLYQQNHCGMYRSEDGGQRWVSIEEGLPSSFGFAAAAHPRDPDTLFLLPLNGDAAGRYVPDARAAVWRTRDAGATWQDLRQGLPQENAFFGVLRQAMATDRLEPAGVYFGTNTGALFASPDEGESWTCLAAHLPAICSVETMVLDGS